MQLASQTRRSWNPLGNTQCARAYWASFADAIPEMAKRYPAMTRDLLYHLENPASAPHALAVAATIREDLVNSCYPECPTWQEIATGVRPPQNTENEAGEWAHGWQFHACSRLELAHRNDVINSMSSSQLALLRSQSGPGAGNHLSAIPKCPELTIENDCFSALLQRRLRLPLSLTARQCNGRTCRSDLDAYGDHRSACPRAGRLKKRSVPMEKMMARICREGGARVRTNVFIRDMNVGGVDLNDNRHIEIIADGLPLYHGR